MAEEVFGGEDRAAAGGVKNDVAVNDRQQLMVEGGLQGGKVPLFAEGGKDTADSPAWCKCSMTMRCKALAWYQTWAKPRHCS